MKKYIEEAVDIDANLQIAIDALAAIAGNVGCYGKSFEVIISNGRASNLFIDGVLYSRDKHCQWSRLVQVEDGED